MDEKLLEELSGWIATENIAKIVLEEMADQGIPITLENAQTIWLSTLVNLWEEVRSACRHSDL